MDGKSILKIKVVKEVDTDGDISWLGRYESSWEPGAIDRRRFDPTYGSGNLVYFVPANHWPHNPARWKNVQEEDRARVIDEYRTLKRADWTYAVRDMIRLGEFGTVWEFVGLYASAEILVCGVIQYISSGGLWGIESDSGKEYFEEVAEEEVSDLKTILIELGFPENEVSEAIGAVAVE